MTVRQISVFLENRPGALHEFTQLLEAHNIDLRALSLAESEDFGIVLAVEIEDKPGALVGILNVLGEKKINLEYMYAFLAKKANSAFVVFRVADNDEAIRVLSECGIHTVSQEEMQELFR